MLPLFALCLAASLDPQGQTPSPILIPEAPHDYYQVPWPSDATDPDRWQDGESFARCVTANFTTVPGGDAAIKRGDRIFLLQGFQFAETLLPLDEMTSVDLSNRVADIAKGESGSPLLLDTLLTVDAFNGLLEHEFVPPVGATPGAFASTVVAASSDWKGVARIIAVDLDGNGRSRDILGIRPDKRILTLQHTPGGYVAGPTFTYNTPVRDALICDYDGDGSPDLVALANKIDIRPADGSAGLEVIPENAMAITSVVRDASGVGDYLVYAYMDGPTSKLVLRSSLGVFQELPLAIAPTVGMAFEDLDVVSLETGDWNEDAWEDEHLVDLLIAHRSFPKTVALLRDPATGEYGTGPDDFVRIAFEQNPSSAPVPENDAKPAFWTDDGFDQNVIVYPADSEDAIAITTSSTAIDSGTLAAMNGPGLIQACYFDPGPGSRTLSVDFILPPGVTPEDYNYVEIVHWKQASEGVSTLEGQSYRTWHSLPTAEAGETLRVDMDVQEPGSLTPPQSGDWGDEGPIYWFVLRFVDGDAIDGSVRSSTGTLVLAWRLEPGSPGDAVPYYDEALMNLPWLLQMLELVETHSTEGITGGADFGVVALTKRLGPFDAGDPPQVSPPVVSAPVVVAQS